MTRGSPDAGHAAQAVTQAQLAPVLAAVVGQTLGHALQPLGPGCLLVPEMRDGCIIILYYSRRSDLLRPLPMDNLLVLFG